MTRWCAQSQCHQSWPYKIHSFCLVSIWDNLSRCFVSNLYHFFSSSSFSNLGPLHIILTKSIIIIIPIFFVWAPPLVIHWIFFKYFYDSLLGLVYGPEIESYSTGLTRYLSLVFFSFSFLLNIYLRSFLCYGIKYRIGG